MIMYLHLLKVIGKKVGMTSDVLLLPDVILRDYNQFPTGSMRGVFVLQ